MISFKRLADQPSMDEVLRRPWIEEVEDYREYKRLRQLAREKASEAAAAKVATNNPTVILSTDGIVDVYEGAECILGRPSEESNPETTGLRRAAVSSHDPTGLGPAGIATTADTLQNADVTAKTRSDSVAV